MMTLKEYIKNKGLTAKFLSDKLNIPPTSMRSYVSGTYKPLPDRAIAIKKISKGLVTEFDDIIKGLKQKSRPGEANTIKLKENKFKSSVSELSTPLHQALFLLSGEAVYLKHRKEFRLRGCPVTAKQIIESANTILKTLGRRPIAYPGLDVPARYNLSGYFNRRQTIYELADL